MSQRISRFTPPGEIQKALSELGGSIEVDESYTRVEGRNVFLVAAAEAADARRELLEDLTFIHPARYFAISAGANDMQQSGIAAEVAVLCHGLSKDQAACSEIITLHVPEEASSALPSVVRGNRVTGQGSELFLLSPEVDSSYYDWLLPECERVFLNSRDFDPDFARVTKLLGEQRTVVDFEWLALSEWRAQVRQAFDRSLLLDVLPALSDLEIEFNPTFDGAKWRASLLLGWLFGKLEVKPHAAGKSGFECYDRQKRVLCGRLLPQSGGQAWGGISAVRLRFSARCAGLAVAVKGGQLVTEFSATETFRNALPLESVEFKSLLRRYFNIGEAVTNYGEALSNALELLELEEGYSAR